MSQFPVETISQIIRHLRSHGGQKLAPLATINQHWQGAVEAILWRHFQIVTADINAFTAFSYTRVRRQAVKHIIFDAEYFKQSTDNKKKTDKSKNDRAVDEQVEESHDKITSSSVVQEQCRSTDTKAEHMEMDTLFRDARHSLSAFQNEHLRFFCDLRKIWDAVASWGSSAEVKFIEIIVNGCSMYEHLGLAFRNDEFVHGCLCADDWLGHCPPLPVLSSVKSLVMRQKVNTTVNLWSAIAGCAVARSLPALKRLEIGGDDCDRRWEAMRKECREG
jgi:hypothetical protein